MNETDSGAPKPSEADRDPDGLQDDAAAKEGSPSPGDRNRGEDSAAGEGCAIDLDSARDRAS